MIIIAPFFNHLTLKGCTMLVGFIVLYLLASIGVGLYAARRVHNTADYAVAGRSLPMAVVIATTFAT